VDSVGKPSAGTNLYAYANDNPIIEVDPSGLWGVTAGFQGTAALLGWAGVGGLYGNISHDSGCPWYSGWSSSVTLVAGGGAAGSVYALTGGLYAGVNNSSNVSQLNGPFVEAGRMGLGAVSVGGFSDGSVSGGGITVGPSLPGSFIAGFAGTTNTWTLAGGNVDAGHAK
jgi:hypothetical protein